MFLGVAPFLLVMNGELQTGLVALLAAKPELKESGGRKGKLSSQAGSKQSCGLQAGPAPSLPLMQAGRM